MILFDRWSKLRKAMPQGRIHISPKEMLPLLRGTLRKEDVPSAILEPATVEELRSCLAFAVERKFRVAVAGGVTPSEIRRLQDQILIFTRGLSWLPELSADRRSARVGAGVSMVSLNADLAARSLRWHPAFPLPEEETLGALIASGWEGLRNWRRGKLQSHVQRIEWMSYEGREFSTGPADLAAGPDASGFLFESHGELGIITAAVIDVEPLPTQRTVLHLELSDPKIATGLLGQLREVAPLPESVIFWGETATQLIREGNDGTVSDGTRAMLTAEWPERILDLPEEWTCYGHTYVDAEQIDAFWQDLLRLTRTAVRLYPHQVRGRFRVPATALADLEQRARDLGRECNLPVCWWGTPETGQVHVWVLQHDDEARTRREAEELLGRLAEDIVRLGGSSVEAVPESYRLQPDRTEDDQLVRTIRSVLVSRCDPHAMHLPLR